MIRSRIKTDVSVKGGDIKMKNKCLLIKIITLALIPSASFSQIQSTLPISRNCISEALEFSSECNAECPMEEYAGPHAI
jgi:hypothetical protein